MGFSRISIAQAQEIMAQDQPVIVDVRDAGSFASAHIQGAVHLDNNSVHEFLSQTPRDRKVLVYCYHGNSSLGAGQFLAEQGFADVMSIDGGFEAWRHNYPVE